MDEIQIRAWNIGFETKTNNVVNGERIYKAHTRIGAAIKTIYSLVMFYYVEITMENNTNKERRDNNGKI